MSDSILAIVAGADTTSAVLSGLFYYLLSNPNTYHRLQDEVDATFPQGTDPFEAAKLADMPYLNAVMYVLITQLSSLPQAKHVTETSPYDYNLLSQPPSSGPQR